MASVDVRQAKSSNVKKMMKLKINSFSIICFDNQKCFLKTGLNNRFDAIDSISHKGWYLFDAWTFGAFYPIT